MTAARPQLFSRPVELVILDVDGVVLDLCATFLRNLEATARLLGLPPDGVRAYWAAVASGASSGHMDLAIGLREFYPTQSPSTLAELNARFQAVQRRAVYPVCEGADETIAWLRELSIPVALCTSNNRETLDRRLLAAHVDPSWFTAIGTGDLGVAKPDPAVLAPIFAATRVPPAHALYVGDWYPDVETARAAGVPFLAVLSGGLSREGFLRRGVSADRIVDRLSDLKTLLVVPSAV